MARVLCVGMAVVDFVFQLDPLPSAAGKLRAEDARIVGGGCAATAAVAVARLGGEAMLAARLGDDEIGAMILAELEAEGVDCRYVHRAPGGRSSFSSICVDAAGERQIVNYRGEGLAEGAGWIAEAPDPDTVLVDTRWPDGAVAALNRARALGVPGVLDAEAPIGPELLAAASHVAFSTQGLASLDDTMPPEATLARVAKRLPAWSCVTDGARGVFLADGGRVPAFTVQVADTLGAGDVWHGAFALRLAEGADEGEAIRFANAAAALKCTRFGGRAGTPRRAETEAFLKEMSPCN